MPTLAEVGQTIKRYANPMYHLRKLWEDLQSLVAALKSFTGETATIEELGSAFRGKLLACFYLSGPLSFVSLAASVYLQRKTQNPFVGQYSEQAMSMVFCTLAYQVFWALGNRGLYRGTLRERFVAFEKDMLPVHGNGIKIGMSFNLVVWPVTSAILFGVQLLNRQAAVNIPAALVQGVINTVFVQPTFMRAMGDFFERWSRVLAERHHRE